ISGNIGLTIAANTAATPGAVTFGGGNSYTGPTWLDGSTVNIKSNAVFGSGNLNLNAGVVNTTSAVTLANPVVLKNAAIAVNSSANASLTFTGPTTVSGLYNTLTINNAGGVTFTSTVSDGPGGPGALTLGGAATGAVLLGSADTYSGGTTINGPNVQ